MKTVTSHWIEKSDANFIHRLRLVGVREVARKTAVSPSMISRWLRRQTGMRTDKFEKIQSAVLAGLKP